MSYEQKVLAVFAVLVFAGHLAVVAFVWKRSKGREDDGNLLLLIKWRILSKTVLLGGIALSFVFFHSWVGLVGEWMSVIGIVSTIASIISLRVAMIRRRPSNPTSGTRPSR